MIPAAFKQVWLVDSEFRDNGDSNPQVHCLVAREFRTGRTLRLFAPNWEPPFDLGRDTLYVSYYAIAEMRCHLALGWPVPSNLLDLFAEFRCLTNGKAIPSGNSLMGALDYYNLHHLQLETKRDMRHLAMRGAPFTEKEIAELLAYCQTDVEALAALLQAMEEAIDFPRALIRGRYMACLAKVEANGVPLDEERFPLLKDSWEGVKRELISRVDAQYGVYDGLSFNQEKFLQYLKRQNYTWPHHPSGAPMLDMDTFKDMTRIYPRLQSLRETRVALGQMRLAELLVGSDGRNRCMLSPFGSITGRNQPSNSRFIFGPSVWLRGLIKPPPGKVLAYIDYSQQEYAIAAALSADVNMKRGYTSDPYLSFAKMAGLVPHDGTRDQYSSERERCKICVLGVQFGMGPETLANKLGMDPAYGHKYFELHRQTYPNYWKFIQAVLDHLMFYGSYTLRFGWTLHAGPNLRPNTAKNFPIQGHGSEMLRLAVVRATQLGVKILAPVHDALLIECDDDCVEDTVRTCQQAMTEASLLVLPNFPVRSDVKLVRSPDRYMDKRGQKMWDTVWGIPQLQSKLT
jgi:DNA polymerase I